MDAHIPVLVVGAGPTGLAVACELRRQGIQCRIVDRAADRPAHQARALTVWPGALDVLARHGGADQVVDAGLRLAASRYWSDDRLLATVRFGIDGGPVPVCEPQPEVERIMTARLTELDGAVEWQTELVDLQDRGNLAEVQLAGPGGVERLTASWVVGCDGANSRVRELAGIEFLGSTYPRSYILGDGEINGYVPRDEVHYHLHRDGVVVVVPLPDGGLRVFAEDSRRGGSEVTDEPAAAPTREQLQQLVDERLPYPLAIGELRWSTRFPVHLRKASTYRSGRCLLAGDAAHIHSPAGGQGMNTGIQDGANLAWKLALVLRGCAGRDRLLDSYPAERAPVAEQVMAAADKQTRLWGVRSWLGRRIRDAVLTKLGRSDVLKQRVVLAMAQNDLNYQRSPAVGKRGGRRALGIGLPEVNLIPVAGTAPAAGRAPLTLRELLSNPRHVLLVLPGTSEGAVDRAREVVRATEPLVDRLAVHILVEQAIADQVGDLPAVIAPDGYAPVGPLRGCALVLVRPDGYVADATTGLDTGTLLYDLQPAPPDPPVATAGHIAQWEG
ncbi:MAG: FAD-dependent monooxygenase [Pseudonocardiaceae bacterium]